MSHDISNHPLLPEDSELTPWQLCVKNAIIEVHSRWAPYAWTSGHGGVTQDLYFKDSRLLKSRRGDQGPASFCCGATFEVFCTAWKNWMQNKEQQDLSVSQMRELIAYFFVYKTDDLRYAYGAKDGLGEYLYNELEWIDCEVYSDPEEAPFGSFIQFQFTRDPLDGGHSAILLGTGKYKNRKIVHVWSSNNYYDKKWEYSKHQKPGHGFDFYYINSVRDGFQREFHIGTVVDPQ